MLALSAPLLAALLALASTAARAQDATGPPPPAPEPVDSTQAGAQSTAPTTDSAATETTTTEPLVTDPAAIDVQPIDSTAADAAEPHAAEQSQEVGAEPVDSKPLDVEPTGSKTTHKPTSTKSPASKADGSASEPADAGAYSDVHVTELTLGMYVTPDKRVAVPMTTFRPEDSISLCVTTQVPPGAARSGTLGVWWTYGPETRLRSLKADVAETFFDGEGHMVFTIENPRTWPAGQYHVEVFLDGVSAGRKDFTVR